MLNYIKPEIELNKYVAVEDINNNYDNWAEEEGLSNGVTTFGLASSEN